MRQTISCKAICWFQFHFLEKSQILSSVSRLLNQRSTTPSVSGEKQRSVSRAGTDLSYALAHAQSFLHAHTTVHTIYILNQAKPLLLLLLSHWLFGQDRKFISTSKGRVESAFCHVCQPVFVCPSGKYNNNNNNNNSILKIVSWWWWWWWCLSLPWSPSPFTCTR